MPEAPVKGPRLLVDVAVLNGSAAALPLSWLDGFDLHAFAPRDLAGTSARDADAVLVRTVTRVDRLALLQLPRLQHVATLSSGTDHLDLKALRERGAGVSTGRGGNARAVADWVQWAVARMGWPAPGAGSAAGDLAGRCVLVVGLGAVGSVVAARLAQRGARVLACDPLRAVVEAGFAHVDLDTALACRPHLVSLHVPLERDGRHPTASLLNEARLATLRGSIVLNAARGGVLDETRAAELRAAGVIEGLGLDCWVGEPQPHGDVVAACDVATPHIAGHSLEGKLDVAWRAVRGLRAAFGLGVPPALADAVRAAVAARPPPFADPFACLDACDQSLRATLAQPGGFEAVRHAHRRTERGPAIAEAPTPA